MNLFCFGYSYTAVALARHFAGRPDVAIRGTRRSASTPAMIPFDGGSPSADVSRALQTATHVLVSIPPDAQHCPALRWFAGDLAKAPALTWVGYLSTVGVYGDRQGGWVDETTPVDPRSERARRRVVAEGAWRAFGAATGKRVEIFRLPGIYGPGRSMLDSLRDGTQKRIVKGGQVFNRIHVDDIAGALARAMTTPTQHLVYNITDDEPAPPQDVVAYAARLLGMQPPPEMPFDTATLSPMAASFYAENKRVRNARMAGNLGYRLRYPTYRDGLAAIFAAEPSG